MQHSSRGQSNTCPWPGSSRCCRAGRGLPRLPGPPCAVLLAKEAEAMEQGMGWALGGGCHSRTRGELGGGEGCLCLGGHSDPLVLLPESRPLPNTCHMLGPAGMGRWQGTALCHGDIAGGNMTHGGSCPSASWVLSDTRDPTLTCSNALCHQSPCWSAAMPHVTCVPMPSCSNAPCHICPHAVLQQCPMPHVSPCCPAAMPHATHVPMPSCSRSHPDGEQDAPSMKATLFRKPPWLGAMSVTAVPCPRRCCRWR